MIKRLLQTITLFELFNELQKKWNTDKTAITTDCFIKII